MTPTIEAARLIKRAARVIPTDIQDMKYSKFIKAMGNLHRGLVLLKDFTPPPVKVSKNQEEILKAADEFCPGWRKRTRRKDTLEIYTRHVTMYLLAKYTGMSLQSIGVECSDTEKPYDHTTVIHGRDCVINAIENEDLRYLEVLHYFQTKLNLANVTITELPQN